MYVQRKGKIPEMVAKAYRFPFMFFIDFEIRGGWGVRNLFLTHGYAAARERQERCARTFSSLQVYNLLLIKLILS